MVCTPLGSTASGAAASVVVRDCAVHRVFDRVVIGRQSGCSVSISGAGVSRLWLFQVGSSDRQIDR